MFIKRSLYFQIRVHLEKPEITLIAGPRQCGKTFLLKLLIEDLKKTSQKTLFFNLDVEEDKRYFSSQNDLIQKIDLELGRQKGVVFIDEIQRQENAGLFLKGIYDLGLPYKFVVSGSGSLELKEKIHESLAGRKKVFNLTTISFFEFADFKTGYHYSNRLEKFFSVEGQKTNQLLREYLRFGGYPKVILSPTASEKQAVILEIFQSYVERDITGLLHLEKTETLSQLVRLLASQAGNLVNISALGSTLGASSPTVKNYLWYLEKTFIISRLPPFTRRTGREISKSPVIYFSDLGLANLLRGAFSRELLPSELGFSFQNLIFNTLTEMLSETAGEVHYWRTKDGAEVDFVVNSAGKIYPLEAKFSANKTTTRALTSFQKKYQSAAGKIITPTNFWQLTKILQQKI